MSHSTVDRSPVSRALARNRLGWKTLGGLLLASAAPLTVAAGGVTNAWAVTRLEDIPIGYLITFVPLGLFAVGYTALARRLPNAGAFYSMHTAGLSRPAGVAAGLVALLSYGAMQVGLVGVLGIVGSEELATVFGVHVAWWVCAYVGWAVIGFCGIFKIDFNGSLMAVLLAVEVVLIVVFDVVQYAHPFGGHVDASAMNPAGLVSAGGTGLVAVVVAIAGFIGFEDGPNYTEESKPRATARAVWVSLVITAVLYTGSAWAMTVAGGPHNVVAGSQQYGTEYMFHLVGPYVPGFLLDVGHLLFITSLFAAGLAFHNTFNRYCFALSRDRVLPYGLSRTWARTKSPTAASVLQTVLAGLFLAVALAAGNDERTTLIFFFNSTAAAAIGVLVLLISCCAAVIGYMARHRDGESVWQAYVAPAAAGAGLLVVGVATVWHTGVLIGQPDGSAWAVGVPAAVGVLIVVGLAWAGIRWLTRPDRYRLIGAAGDDDYHQALRRGGHEAPQATAAPVVLGEN